MMAVVLLTNALLCAATAAAAAAPPPLPRPSAPQLWYSQGEIMALVHFNMASFVRWLMARLVPLSFAAPQCPPAPRPRLTPSTCRP
jgi:hypothetical protein